MKELITATLKATPALQTEVDRRIWNSGVLGRNGIPANPKKPYILFKELEPIIFSAVQGTSRCAEKAFEFYVHDERGSFTRINRIIVIMREALLALAATRSPSGAFCMDARWGFTSRELEDNEYDVNLKFLRMHFACSEA